MFFALEYRQYSIAEDKQLKVHASWAWTIHTCCFDGRLAVTRVQISIEWFRLFSKQEKMKKIVINWMAIIVMVIMNAGLVSCNSDDDETSTVIPSGTYIEENGDPSELFTMVINGYNIKVTITQNGKVWKTYEGTYKIDGNTIYITTSGGTESGYFKMSGNRVTIGEIIYIKQ